MNSGRHGVKRLGLGASKTVSRSRIFKKVNDTKIAELQEKQMKKRTYAKVMWAVRAYQEWRESRLGESEMIDAIIEQTDLYNVMSLKQENLQYSLCHFIPEVTKVKDGTDYPAKTLYKMVIAIQKYVNEKGLPWKLIDDPQFSKLKAVLDNVMKERTESNIGTTVRRAEVIDPSIEESLWKSNFLGEDTPDKLRSTVLFLLGMNCGLRAGDEHYDLRCDGPKKLSQIQFKRSSKGQRCVVYSEDSITKTNDGGLSSLRKDRKVVWVYPSSNPIRCPVRLIDKYMSLLPPVKTENSKHNFYLRSLEKPNPACWYS